MIFNKSWNVELHRILRNLSAHNPKTRVALVGIGSELFGDDAIGIALVRKLRSRIPMHDRICLLETGPSPENYLSVLRKFSPHLVILIDAAQLGCTPGEIRLIPAELIDGITWSTHTYPLSLLAEYLASQLNCQIFFLGIQPSQSIFQQGISKCLEITLRENADEITKILLSPSHDVFNRKAQNEIQFN